MDKVTRITSDVKPKGGWSNDSDRLDKRLERKIGVWKIQRLIEVSIISFLKATM